MYIRVLTGHDIYYVALQHVSKVAFYNRVYCFYIIEFESVSVKFLENCQTFGDHACHPERSEGSLRQVRPILCFAHAVMSGHLAVLLLELFYPHSGKFFFAFISPIM